MNREIKMRLLWVRHYQDSGDAGFVCRRCGISRPTLRKWVKRYEKSGVEGLQSKSRRPKYSPNKKINEQNERWILELRQQRKLGARRIQNELRRVYKCSLSLATIHKVLKNNNVKPIKRVRRKSNFRNTCFFGHFFYQFCLSHCSLPFN